MTLDVDFPILHGKVGMWPGDINPQCAEIIYKTAVSFQSKSNPIFVDLGAGPGRSTIFLAAAAQQIGGKVYAVDDWSEPIAALWFNRAMRLFRMRELVDVLSGPTQQIPPGDFVLIRAVDEPTILQVWDNGVNLGGALMVMGNIRPDLIKQAGEHGLGFHMWRAPKAKILPLVLTTSASLNGSHAVVDNGNESKVEADEAVISKPTDL